MEDEMIYEFQGNVYCDECVTDAFISHSDDHGNPVYLQEEDVPEWARGAKPVYVTEDESRSHFGPKGPIDDFVWDTSNKYPPRCHHCGTHMMHPAVTDEQIKMMKLLCITTITGLSGVKIPGCLPINWQEYENKLKLHGRRYFNSILYSIEKGIYNFRERLSPESAVEFKTSIAILRSVAENIDTVRWFVNQNEIVWEEWPEPTGECAGITYNHSEHGRVVELSGRCKCAVHQVFSSCCFGTWWESDRKFHHYSEK